MKHFAILALVIVLTVAALGLLVFLGGELARKAPFLLALVLYAGVRDLTKS